MVVAAVIMVHTFYLNSTEWSQWRGGLGVLPLTSFRLVRVLNGKRRIINLFATMLPVDGGVHSRVVDREWLNSVLAWCRIALYCLFYGTLNLDDSYFLHFLVHFQLFISKFMLRSCSWIKKNVFLSFILSHDRFESPSAEDECSSLLVMTAADLFFKGNDNSS